MYMTELEQERFRAAREKALQRTKGAQGIGTLSEKTLHAALKAYYEPDDESREVALGGFVADIVGEEGIIEIQTRGFERLRGKLEAFLEAARVTVVYPVAVERQLRWIDPETGEVLPPRKSTKKGIPFDVLPELYKIKPLLTHPNFRLRLALLALTDYKYLDGYGKQRKIRASRVCRRRCSGRSTAPARRITPACCRKRSRGNSRPNSLGGRCTVRRRRRVSASTCCVRSAFSNARERPVGRICTGGFSERKPCGFP